MINLGKIIDVTQYKEYINETKKFETIYHTYGTEFNIPNYPCWMTYNTEGIGSISFTRHTYKNKLLLEMARKIVDIINNITVNDFSPVIERVHIIKTVGSILPHRDEANRMCCINIGLDNSSSAITKISNNPDFDFFNDTAIEYTLEDGYAYLLNTNNIHAVIGDKNIERYLITYGFGRNFNDVKHIFLKSN